MPTKERGTRRFLTAVIAALALGTALASGAAAAQSDTQARPERLQIAEIAAMPAGSWLHYGRPWRDIDPGRGDNCGVDFGSVLGAWNGVLWDGRYVWSWAAGGHGDGCFNGIVRYDLQAGKPEMVVPHLALNVPLCRPFVKSSGEEDCYWDPYVSSESYPGGMDGRVAEWHGAFLRPRSSHMYNNMVRIGAWVYLVTGHIYESSKPDAQVWRFNATADDIATTIERLPDRFDPEAGPDRDNDGKPDGDMIGNFAINWVQRPGKPLLLISGSTVCQPDLVAGNYDCTLHKGISFSTSTTLAWDEGRQGLWAIDARLNRLTFSREVDGHWVFDNALSVIDEELINKRTVGSGGLCLVPTETGANPVIWGQDSTLLRWDGKQLQIIDLPGGPTAAPRRIYNKWTWNDDLGVCLGTWRVDEGIWAYKPDFAGATQAAVADPSSPVPARAPDPDPAETATSAAAAAQAPAPLGLPVAPKVNTALVNNPLGVEETAKARHPRSKRKVEEIDAVRQTAATSEKAAAAPKDSATAAPELSEAMINLQKLWWTDPAHYPSFAGHLAAPAPWTPAAWNEPAVLEPEAPDIDDLCSGPWAELHYSSEAELEGSRSQIKTLANSGTLNVRVYLHPLRDANGKVIPYRNGLDVRKAACTEVIGVPDKGERPVIAGGVAPGTVGIIARGFDMPNKAIGWSGNKATNTFIRYIVMHDLGVEKTRSVWGVSSAAAPLTYIEIKGSRFGPDPGWHVVYLERSIGQLVALNNIFFGSGRNKHTFKNLAHQSRIEGNVFSNVGVGGEALDYARNGTEIAGLMPLDLYLCTETIFRNNTVVFRTSSATRAFMAYRGRRAWGNCDKGRRLDNGRWELWPPESTEYHDPARWAEIQEAVKDFDLGLEVARQNPWLFTHLNEDNTFIAVLAFERGGEPAEGVDAMRVVTLRPVADNTIYRDLASESLALAQACNRDVTCYEAGMSEGLRYAYEHVPEVNQRAMANIGQNPRGMPIPAPEGWTERAAVYWDANQTFIDCSADLTDCIQRSEPRPYSNGFRDWDDVVMQSPPRIIME